MHICDIYCVGIIYFGIYFGLYCGIGWFFFFWKVHFTAIIIPDFLLELKRF
jgi:hypothetical protein